MKYHFVFIGLFLLSTTVSAQLIDTLAAGSIGAAASVQGVKSTRQGLSMLQQNQLIQNINSMVMDIKINSMSGYQGLSKRDFQGSSPFGKLEWDVGAVGNSQFYLEIKGMDKSTCIRLIDLIRDYTSIEVNGTSQKNNACSDDSKIKWVFE